MKDTVTRYIFSKCWPKSVNNEFRYHESSTEIINVYADISCPEIQRKSHVLKALPSLSLNPSLEDKNCQKVRCNHYLKIFKKHILFPYQIRVF